MLQRSGSPFGGRSAAYVRHIRGHGRTHGRRGTDGAQTGHRRGSDALFECNCETGARASARRKAGCFATLTDGRKPPCGGSGSATLFHPLRSCTFESTLSGGKEAEAKFTAEMTCQSNSSNCTYREARYCRPTTHSACLPPCSWSSTDCTVFSSRHASQDINRGIHRGIERTSNNDISRRMCYGLVQRIREKQKGQTENRVAYRPFSASTFVLLSCHPLARLRGLAGAFGGLRGHSGACGGLGRVGPFAASPRYVLMLCSDWDWDKHKDIVQTRRSSILSKLDEHNFTAL